MAKADRRADRRSSSTGSPSFLSNLKDSHIFIGLLLLALASRFIALGKADMWTDEILFANLTSVEMSPLAVFSNMLKSFLNIGHLPLPYVFHNIVLHLSKGFVEDPLHSAFLQRLPAALWGSLAIPVFFLFAKRLLGKVAALGASLLFCFSFYAVFYSREAYVYAPIMFFATLTFLFYVPAMVDGKLSRRAAIGAGIGLLGAVYSHVSGCLLVVVLTLYATLFLLCTKAKPEQEETRKARLKLWGLCLGALCFTIPFFWQYLSGKSPMNFQPAPAIPAILNDVISKMFLGASPVASVLAWIIFVVGALALTKKSEKRHAQLIVLIATVATMGIIAYSSSKTLYSSRYFCVIAPGYYLICTAGLLALGGAFQRLLKRRAQPVFVLTLLVPILAIHIGIYLPAAYALPAKSVNFGGISDWLNKNLKQGTPYVIESAYELRFVSGYFPTPGLVPAAPHVHGPGLAEMNLLRERQRGFMQAFPNAPFIESARHGSERLADVPIWDWPHKNFRQVHHVLNEPLRKLTSRGIWPQTIGSEGRIQEFDTPIWYNTDADIEAIARERRDVVQVFYEGWACVQIQQGVYARYVQSAQGQVRVRNLTGEPLPGVLDITGGIAGPENGFELTVALDGKILLTEKKWSGTLWSQATPHIVLPPGDHALSWSVRGPAGVQLQGLLLSGVAFRPGAAPAPNIPAQ